MTTTSITLMNVEDRMDIAFEVIARLEKDGAELPEEEKEKIIDCIMSVTDPYSIDCLQKWNG